MESHQSNTIKDQLTNDTIEDLLGRYKDRLSRIWKEPNPYYDKIIYEVSEVKNWIVKLEKIKNGRTGI